MENISNIFAIFVLIPRNSIILYLLIYRKQFKYFNDFCINSIKFNYFGIYLLIQKNLSIFCDFILTEVNSDIYDAYLFIQKIKVFLRFSYQFQ